MLKRIVWFIHWMKFELEWLLEDLDDRFRHSNWALSILTQPEEMRQARATANRLGNIVIDVTPPERIVHINSASWWPMGALCYRKTKYGYKEKQS